MRFLLIPPPPRFERIPHVVCVCPVLQILQSVVVRVVVEMPHYATLRLTEERQRHQIVNSLGVLEAETDG